MSGRKSALYRSIQAHYNRKKWEKRQKFVTETKPEAAKAQRMADKSGGWIQDPHSSFKSPFIGHFHGDHEYALHEAFRFGGAQWSNKKKREFGHDISNIKLTRPATNIKKSAKPVDEWLPAQNIVKYLLRKEKTGQKYNLHVTKSQNKVYEKHLGRKAKLPVGLSVEKTKYCTSCHINHGIGDHRGIAKEY